MLKAGSKFSFDWLSCLAISTWDVAVECFASNKNNRLKCSNKHYFTSKHICANHCQLCSLQRLWAPHFLFAMVDTSAMMVIVVIMCIRSRQNFEYFSATFSIWIALRSWILKLIGLQMICIYFQYKTSHVHGLCVVYRNNPLCWFNLKLPIETLRCSLYLVYFNAM